MKYYTKEDTKLYHMSFNSKLPNILIPRQPASLNEDHNEHHLPDRVSFAPTIRQCWLALFYNIMEEDRLYKKLTFNIYRLNSHKPLEVIDPKLVLKYVYDASVTGEVCVVEPAPIIKLGTIEIQSDLKHPVRLNSKKKTIVGYEPIFFNKPRITSEVIRYM